MRNLNLLDIYRSRAPRVMQLFGSYGDHSSGVFNIVSRDSGDVMTVITSIGNGWEHVSVSKAKRNPSWNDMCLIKELFFHDEEAVVQFHPPRSQYVNYHPHCLHLWKPMDGELKLPPANLVGPMTAEPMKV